MGTSAGAKQAWKTIRANQAKRRAAAQKAVETRRKNQLLAMAGNTETTKTTSLRQALASYTSFGKQKRSEAARKANVTRGAKGRRAAALKAWRTRRGIQGN